MTKRNGILKLFLVGVIFFHVASCAPQASKHHENFVEKHSSLLKWLNFFDEFHDEEEKEVDIPESSIEEEVENEILDFIDPQTNAEETIDNPIPTFNIPLTNFAVRDGQTAFNADRQVS